MYDPDKYADAARVMGLDVLRFGPGYFVRKEGRPIFGVFPTELTVGGIPIDDAEAAVKIARMCIERVHAP